MSDTKMEDKSQISDGYHTFAELYEHRHALFIALANTYAPTAFKTLKNKEGEKWEGREKVRA